MSSRLYKWGFFILLAGWLGPIAEAAAPPSDVSHSFIFPDALQVVRLSFSDIPPDGPSRKKLWEEAELDPDSLPETWRKLAIGSYADSDFPRVLQSLDQYEQRTEEMPDDLVWLRALALEGQGQWDEAIAAWEQAQQQKPDDPLSGIRISFCLMMAERGPDAFQTLRQWALRFPHDTTIHHMLGMMYWMQGNARDAWRALARVAATEHPPKESLLFLSWITLQQGDVEEAIGWMRRALSGAAPPWQAETLFDPAFAELRTSPLFEELRAELDLTEDMIPARPVEASIAQAGGTVRTEIVEKKQYQLPESLQVHVRLQDVEKEEADADGRVLEDDTNGILRLRPSARPSAISLWENND